MEHKLFFDDLSKTPDDNIFEIVELKGRGHPDTLSDTIAARIAIDYAKWWMHELGVGIKEVPHHNFDKVLLSGGEVEIGWGEGRILTPFNVIIAGNATTNYKGVEIPLLKVIDRAVAGVLRRNVGPKSLWNVDISALSNSCQTLSNTYSQGLFANDTSFGTGHYPMTLLESTVKKINEELERIMDEKDFLGTDVKIMGRRVMDEYHFTIAAAIKSCAVKSPEEYSSGIKYIKDRILRIVPEKSVVNVNQNDTPKKGRGTENYYLLVTGSSVEGADPGQVGRGNRITGLITPFRPQTMEATAGKNLTRHVGGFYNIWAQKIARQVWDKTGVGSQVVIVSEIGKPVDQCYIGFSSKERVDKGVVDDVCVNVMSTYYDYLDGLIKRGSEHYPFNYII